jgi:hypothetical protein
MAATLIIETDSGMCRDWVHPHNGYYAGDFSAPGTRTIVTAEVDSRADLDGGRA